MRRKLIHFFLFSAVLFMLPGMLQAQLTFVTNSGAIIITGYTGSPTNLVIPSATNGHPVTSIADYALEAHPSLLSVTIPNSVTNIGDRVFTLCQNLTNIIVLSGNPDYSSLNGVLFNHDQTMLVEFADGLKGSYTVPNTVVSIATNAFYICTNLNNVIITNNVARIEDDAFYNCTGLTNATIGNSVTNLGAQAFYACTGLSHITLGSGVVSIGYQGFMSCSSLLSVVIPNSLTNLGDYAFYTCSGLTNLVLGTNLTDVGANVFNSCTNLPRVVIPNSVTNIGNSAFKFCTSLTNVTLGSGVRTIENLAFFISGLISVTIPVNVTNIGGEAFDYCANLTNITVTPGNPDYSSLNGVLFDPSQTTLIQFPGGLKNYTVPSGVTNIGIAFYYAIGLTNVVITNNVTSTFSFFNSPNLVSVVLGTNVTDLGQLAFDGCVRLASINLPDSITSIEDYAFADCTNLTSITIPNSVTHLGNFVFDYCSSLITATLPNSITNISDQLFSFCTSLTTVTVGNGVKSIGSGAFVTCPALRSVYFQGNAPTPNNDSNTFSGDTNATVYYIPGTTGWGTTFDGLPCAPAFGTTTYGHLPVIIYTTAGTNQTLQMSTNSASGNWVTVSNKIPLIGVEFTNPPGQIFFRLQAASGSVPSPGITLYGNLPVLFYPTNANYAAQMTTNLTVHNWTSISGVNSLITVQVTNAPPNAVFRLH